MKPKQKLARDIARLEALSPEIFPKVLGKNSELIQQIISRMLEKDFNKITSDLCKVFLSLIKHKVKCRKE